MSKYMFEVGLSGETGITFFEFDDDDDEPDDDELEIILQALKEDFSQDENVWGTYYKCEGEVS